ncbi:MAG: chemotaxis protein CheW [Candidatus Raymondbacteria bacterium RifOxyA12_full_50_37]|uniref:Chemotaxis protein CheW n=1 Tax=Candidatus Raymondbacteria bacterium RIFOXYD12_FULL_49_13 TaxID=1817890 RepID=A0A1F7F329_UNCRA|nr:MAG: chemotaxis protein CheW [Candidatus Raymondbacteria bacterium RifOxyA12_full_50_37]OGJ89137.1 MAG: chemotaxis protein CheW [Candidatus Raymondbacteria bacterium RIFOXYA2_FULL_49_16]OGJ96513.1 MAG: chemotaxis protein CheW [Candidatus Raymondbacteria bacterium RifOxyB12_full_50_8]OGJ96619.1 MAG: chemotaxis protein CheW [Candidatus Raymondbacteria bacterium RIFOXYC2_FULL_50_21]OGK01070.1 MAG: chemotaxis protein CheW [Candidatus Raymondbacteria bacterium RIFOXYD12_FULL_49_13]OGK04323.1 MAG
MNTPLAQEKKIVLFTLDQPRYALYLSAVERVVRAVEITPLPKAPEIVLGVLNMQGKVLPVLDIRKRFRLPVRQINTDDRLIIARTSRRPVALVVDSVEGIRELTENQMVDAKQALPFAEYIKGVATLDDNLVLIHDIDQFLSLDEERDLKASMAQGVE